MGETRPGTTRIEALAAAVTDEYASTRRLLSFGEWFELLCEEPSRHARTAAQYVKDAMDHFGQRQVRTPSGMVRRFCIFDRPYDEGHRLVGQEAAQNAMYEALEGFTQLGRTNRMLLLHGPNGSAKSTLLDCLLRGVEAYAKTDDGAVYAFSWVFPRNSDQTSGIGFSSSEIINDAPDGSFAKLGDDLIQARLADETRDNPIYLIPLNQRRRLIDDLSSKVDGAFSFGHQILSADLSARNRKIFDALLHAYNGELERVLCHIRVERTMFSRAYRCGLVDVEPKQTQDARSFPVTGDRAFSNLPASVAGQSLYGAGGDLVDANRGIINFADLLKRPYEHYKYLLTATENGRVALDHINLDLDIVFTGSANDIDLLQFRAGRAADYRSFRARLHLVPAPYLLDYRVERKIYQEQVGDLLQGIAIAPHLPRILALWGVMTRLRRPDPEHYDVKIRSVVEGLSPIDKADLFAYGRVPRGLSSEEARDLLATVPAMHEERHDYAVVTSEGSKHILGDYEGSFGASVRDLKNVLLACASEPGVTCITVPTLFDELKRYMGDSVNHKWMLLEPTGHGFNELGDRDDEETITSYAWNRWLDLSDQEVREAMGLVDEERYMELFVKYVKHAKHFVKKEQIFDNVTGESTNADVSFMEELETVMDPKATPRFRADVLARIGAWALSHPNEDPAYEEIFADYFARLREDYYRQQRNAVGRGIQFMLDLLAADEGEGTISESHEQGAGEEERAQAALAILLGESNEGVEGGAEGLGGHTRQSLKETLVALNKHRY
jgi:predicted Ser/Thr protein kinase